MSSAIMHFNSWDIHQVDHGQFAGKYFGARSLGMVWCEIRLADHEEHEYIYPDGKGHESLLSQEAKGTGYFDTISGVLDAIGKWGGKVAPPRDTGLYPWATSSEAIRYAHAVMAQEYRGQRVVDEPKKPTPKALKPIEETVQEKKRRLRSFKKRKGPLKRKQKDE